ncbi:MAG: metalloregulator ArsR/SmtB family transcription factor [Melioribacteraceae bacterium]
MEISKSIEIMKSLADTSRLQVLNAVLQKPQYVEELAHRINLAVSTVSFHLKKLEKAGLVFKKKDQYYIVYQVNDEIFNLTLRELTSFDNIEKFVQDERVEKYRQKVLKTFMKNKRLTKLPVQRKKKLIILDEFIKKFNTNKKYTENEVDSLINETYDDHCTIRRLLIEEGMMQRENQIYWLTEDGEKK